VASVARLVADTGLTTPTVTAALNVLCGSGITGEITGKKRNRLFSYQAYLDILRQGTEPL